MKDINQQARKNPTVKQHKEPNTQASFKSDLPYSSSRTPYVTHTNLHSHLFGYKSGRKIYTSALDFTLHAEPRGCLKCFKCVSGRGLNFNLHFKVHLVVSEKKSWRKEILL